MKKELNIRTLAIGCSLGLCFALGNAYLGLRSGVTLSTSIPTALIAIALLRLFTKQSTLLEANMIQTLASASDAVVTGSIFTLPALVILGADLTWTRILAIAFLGGLMGVLIMVPLRHPLMVEEARYLPYPEGHACAALLQAKESRKGPLLLAIWGIVISECYKLLSAITSVWKPIVGMQLFRSVAIALDTTPGLLGIGAIIGSRFALMIVAGGAVAWWALVPLVATFQPVVEPALPGSLPTLSPSAAFIWANYIRYVGIGALALGGLSNLARLSPSLFRAFKGHMKQLLKDAFRPHRDLPFLWVIIGLTIATLLLATFLPWSSLLILLPLALFFVALTAATVGLLGVSANPIPGVMVCTLLIVGCLFLAFGWVTKSDLFIATTIGCVVGVAIAMAAETSQDLKTGVLLQATPQKQQLGMLIVLLPAALLIATVLPLFVKTGLLGTEELPAPQASLMALVIDGILEENIPFHLVGIGVLLGLVVELLGAHALPFALGLFLPLSTSVALGIGGAAAWLMGNYRDQAMLLGAGLVAGDAIMGILAAFLKVMGWAAKEPILGGWASLTAYAIVLVLFLWLPRRKAYA